MSEDPSLPVVYEETKPHHPKWEIAAKILAYNGWKRGISKTGAVRLAAETVGVHYQTIMYWGRNPDFIGLVEQQEARIIATATEALINHFEESSTACLGVLQNLRPNKWDPRIRLEKLKARLQSQLTKEMLAQAPDLPVPVYVDATTLPDPDNGERPKGYDEFRPLPETP